MTILKSRSYIATNPRFALTSAAVPKLQRGQMTKLYDSLVPFPTERGLEELAERCTAQEYERDVQEADSARGRANISAQVNPLSP